VTCPLFVELCAGTAALSLRLAAKHARPPVSRMGAKTGYANVILRVLGLRPGQGADRYLWCEPDDGVRLLLHAYTDRMLAHEAAQIIRSWKDEEPRALWERLRAEGPARCPPVDAREVARWLCSAAMSMRAEPSAGFAVGDGCNTVWAGGTPQTSTALRLAGCPELPATITPDARKVDPREVARWARIVTANRLVNPDPVEWKNTGEGGYVHGGENFCTKVGTLADGFAALPGVEAREVARFALGMVWSVPKDKGWHKSGFCGPGHVSKSGKVPFPSGTTYCRHIDARFSRTPTLPALITDDARPLEPANLPRGTVVYADVPYENTTPYAHLFPRSEWLPVVRKWADAGALVCISEAEPIPALMAEGWHAVEITGERVGQKRTFSKQQQEWLTMNREPAWRPSVQAGLFGAGKGSP